MDDVLAFDGQYSPFVSVSVPPPGLSRSRSHGYESDASAVSSYNTSGHPQQYQPTLTAKSSFFKQTTPTSIDSYYPVATNEYAQLAELWSASSSPLAFESQQQQQSPLKTAARASIDSCGDVSSLDEAPHDGLLDLFMQAKPAMPKLMRSSSDSTHTTAAASSFSSMMPKLTRSSSAPTPPGSLSKPTKTKSSSKNKKCTYAARRREVSWLRKETSTLEAQLQTLQSNIQQRERTRESVELEKTLLARAREENERLRAVVMSQEAQIRRSDGLVSLSTSDTSSGDTGSGTNGVNTSSDTNDINMDSALATVGSAN